MAFQWCNERKNKFDFFITLFKCHLIARIALVSVWSFTHLLETMREMPKLAPNRTDNWSIGQLLASPTSPTTTSDDPRWVIHTGSFSLSSTFLKFLEKLLQMAYDYLLTLLKLRSTERFEKCDICLPIKQNSSFWNVFSLLFFIPHTITCLQPPYSCIQPDYYRVCGGGSLFTACRRPLHSYVCLHAWLAHAVTINQCWM